MKPIEGDIIGPVEAAMTFIRRNTSMAVTFDGGLERKERWEYPLDAVREAVTNAVCHRDYADSPNAVVKIFDDRLEVWNPGSLPAGLTVEDLKKPHESKPRNKLIARCFFLIKYIEQFGTGTGRMLQDCREAGVPEPEFESGGDSFRIVFRRVAPLGVWEGRLHLNARQKKALDYVGQHGRITRSQYEQITQAPKRTAARDLTDLVKRQVVVREGSGKDSWYRLRA